MGRFQCYEIAEIGAMNAERAFEVKATLAPGEFGTEWYSPYIFGGIQMSRDFPPDRPSIPAFRGRERVFAR